MMACRLQSVVDTARSSVAEWRNTDTLNVFHQTHLQMTPVELLKLKHKHYPDLLIWHREEWNRMLVLDKWTEQTGWSNIWTR